MPHRTREAILEGLKSVTVEPHQRYQHYKTKQIYVIDGIVILEATDEPAISYHDESFPELTWIRPYADFIAEVGGIPRFSLLS